MRSSIALLLVVNGLACTSLNPAFDETGMGNSSGSGVGSTRGPDVVTPPDGGPASGGSGPVTVDSTTGTVGSTSVTPIDSSDGGTTTDAMSTTDSTGTTDTGVIVPMGCEMLPPTPGTICHVLETLDTPVGCTPGPLLAADLDGDSLDELLVACVGGDLLLYHGTPDGPGLREPVGTLGPSPREIAAGDFDEDGFLDVVVAHEDEGTSLRVFLDLYGFLDTRMIDPGGPTTSVAVGSWYGSGILDLAVVLPSSNEVQMMLGDGFGDFTPLDAFVVPGEPRDVAMALVDSDVEMSIDMAVVSRATGDVTVLLNDAMGGLAGTTILPDVGGFPEHVLLNDVENNGTVDVLTNRTAGFHDFRLNRGSGNGNFNINELRNVGDDVVGLIDGNFDGNAYPDAAFADFGNNEVFFLMLIEIGVIGEEAFAIPGAPIFITAGQMTDDTVDDVAVSTDAGEVLVLRTIPTP